MIEIAKDPRFGNTHAFLLFENPQDVLAAVEGGVPIESINVGSMAHSTGKTMVNKCCQWTKKTLKPLKNFVIWELNLMCVKYQMTLELTCSI